MKSTFMGLETARRGMTTQQYALETTGHNISNANTPGYTRQRVNFEATDAYPSAASMNRSQIPGQMGMGVKAGSVQRVREGFLDAQFRGENSKFGYWNMKAEALGRMEDIMNEPSDEGLAKTLDLFWQSLHDLSSNPHDSGARSVVRERGIAVADTFTYVSNSLTQVQDDLNKQTGVMADEINSIARRIDDLNKQIGGIEPHGYLPNDLYDERDLLLDELSEIVDIEIEVVKSGGNATEIAEGKLSVFIVGSDGTRHELLTGEYLTAGPNEVSVTFTDDHGTEVEIGGQQIALDNELGRLSGLINMHGEYKDMLTNLDEMAYAFVEKFNDVHSAGWTIADIEAGERSGQLFFEDISDVAGAAKSIKLDQAIVDSRDNIAAATDPNAGEKGNGENARKLAEVKNEVLPVIGSEENVTIEGFYQGIIGEMAVGAQEANRMDKNSDTLRLSVEQRRQSISGVSLDEEVIDLIRFQQAYNASARMVTVIDEMLDRIINGMGVGGR